MDALCRLPLNCPWQGELNTHAGGGQEWPGYHCSVGDEEQRRLDAEREEREVEEVESFRRRAEWWRRHYGDSPDAETAGRLREAAQAGGDPEPAPPTDDASSP